MLQTTPTVITEEQVTEPFIQELKEAFPAGDEDHNPLWYEDAVKRFVTNPNNIFMVAYNNGHIVAFLHGHAYDRLERILFIRSRNPKIISQYGRHEFAADCIFFNSQIERI